MKRLFLLAGVAVLGFAAYPVLAYLFPPLSVSFWQLAVCRQLDYKSSSAVKYLTLSESPFARQSFWLLFEVGTPEAKLYALAGFRDRMSQAEFDHYAAELGTHDVKIHAHLGDTNTVDRVGPWIELVKRGDFPIYQRR